MKYPSFLKKNDTVCIIATSCGSAKEPYRSRTQKGITNFESYGYHVKKGGVIFRQKNWVSAPHEIRAKDFMKAYKSKNNQMVWSTAGGELMMGMLPYVDFEKIKKLDSKFFVGFSDNTNLTFTLTTICDIATIYGSGIAKFAYDNLPLETVDLLKIMTGEKLSFDSYPLWHGPNSYVEDYPKNLPMLYNDAVMYQSISEHEECFKGRIIGGCLDILICLCGTKYDNVTNFIEKYKDDGIIWYLDNCELTSLALYRALFQLREANWFKYVKGFVIGRNGSFNEPGEYSYKQAIIDAIGSLNVPIIYDSDISHASPNMPIINGAIATVGYKDNKGNITFTLK